MQVRVFFATRDGGDFEGKCVVKICDESDAKRTENDRERELREILPRRLTPFAQRQNDNAKTTASAKHKCKDNYRDPSTSRCSVSG